MKCTAVVSRIFGKGLSLAALSAALLCSIASAPHSDSLALEQGERLPELVLASTTGPEVPFSLAAYKGKVILLDVWASWCTPCRYSMPWLSELQERYGKDNFQVVTVNVDSDSSDAAEIIQMLSQDVVVEYDPEGKIAEMLQVEAMPTSFLIDPSGSVISVTTGAKDSDKEKIEELIKSLLGHETA